MKSVSRMPTYFKNTVFYTEHNKMGNCSAYAMNVNGSDDFPGSDTWIHGGIISMRDPEWFWHIPYPEVLFERSRSIYQITYLVVSFKAKLGCAAKRTRREGSWYLDSRATLGHFFWAREPLSMNLLITLIYNAQLFLKHLSRHIGTKECRSLDILTPIHGAWKDQQTQETWGNLAI